MEMAVSDGASMGCWEVGVEGCTAAWLPAPVGGEGAGEGGQREQALVFDGDDAFVRLLVHSVCMVSEWGTGNGARRDESP